MTQDFKFYLMRHGVKAYENGRGGFREPAFDPPLANHLGIKEAAEVLRTKNVIQIVSSPFLRCRETAEVVATEMRLFRPINIAFEFREYLGNWVKKDRRQKFNGNYFDNVTKEKFDAVMKKSDAFKSYGTTTIKIFENDFNSFKERIHRLADVIKTRTRYKRECIITHNVVIEHLLAELGCSINKSLIKPASVIEVCYENGAFHASIITDTDVSEDLSVGSYDNEKTIIIDSDEDELLISLNNLAVQDK